MAAIGPIPRDNGLEDAHSDGDFELNVDESDVTDDESDVTGVHLFILRFDPGRYSTFPGKVNHLGVILDNIWWVEEGLVYKIIGYLKDFWRAVYIQPTTREALERGVRAKYRHAWGKCDQNACAIVRDGQCAACDRAGVCRGYLPIDYFPSLREPDENAKKSKKELSDKLMLLFLSLQRAKNKIKSIQN